MDIFLMDAMGIIASVVLLIFVTLGPFLVVPVGLWVGLWVAEAFFKAFPLGTGKPAAWAAHELRGLYTKLLGMLWSLFAKFAKNVGKGFVKLVKKGKERLQGSSAPPPTSPSPP
jgi:hypothetical protein